MPSTAHRSSWCCQVERAATWPGLPKHSTCLSIVDPVKGTLTEIYERGRPVTQADYQALFQQFKALLNQVGMVTLCGSLPSGVPSSLFSDLARAAREAGVPAVLDTSGEALRLGLEQGQPDMLKCNRSELAEVTGQPLASLEEIKKVASALSEQHHMRVVVTLGAAGAVAAESGNVWTARAPLIKAVSPVGSGDAFLAGLACGLLSGRPFDESLQLAIAAGSANALQLGAGRLNLADVETLIPQVQVKEEKM